MYDPLCVLSVVNPQRTCKTSSVKCHLLNSSLLPKYRGKQCGPRSGFTLSVKKASKTFHQMTKQMTFIVIGSLGIKTNYFIQCKVVLPSVRYVELSPLKYQLQLQQTADL